MHRLTAVLALVLVTTARADGPADNLVDKVRKVPPPGVAVPEADRAEVQAGLKRLADAIAELRPALKGKANLLALLPDVEIYHKAVAYAFTYDEIHNLKEVPIARQLLQTGMKRAAELKAGRAPWTTATGAVVRGYRSKLDDSVQAYGLVVPRSFVPDGGRQHRLDVWLHGRFEKQSELVYIDQREKATGPLTPADTFVLHPYGRFSNAFRFAGEVDVFEAMAHVRQQYPIDSNRLLIRGFSMGGAGCWSLATHHPTVWAAAAPGAGFSETAEFLKVFQNETLAPPDYQRKLWRLHDSTDVALNLANLPTVVYSGEKDRQKQAADIMAVALAKEGINMLHIIGVGAGHSYTPEATAEINRRIDTIAARGRDPLPKRVKFTTFSLRYPESGWVRLEGMGKHWERARVDAELHAGIQAAKLKTENVTALTLEMGPGLCPFDPTKPPVVHLDGQTVSAAPVLSDHSWQAHFRKVDDQWQSVPTLKTDGLRKRPGLQGPIDDAFMERFLFVRPSGTPSQPAVAKWVEKEMEHAIVHWRQQFRGDVRIKADTAVTPDDIATSNLVLWGDPASNAVMKKIAEQLPVSWDAGRVKAMGQSYASDTHVPVMIYPNPLNPERYVVLNSGFTYREYDYLNNARQTPKLPDWAVVDVSVPATSQVPGKIVAAGFFDESWK